MSVSTLVVWRRLNLQSFHFLFGPQTSWSLHIRLNMFDLFDLNLNKAESEPVVWDDQWWKSDDHGVLSTGEICKTPLMINVESFYNPTWSDFKCIQVFSYLKQTEFTLGRLLCLWYPNYICIFNLGDGYLTCFLHAQNSHWHAVIGTS